MKYTSQISSTSISFHVQNPMTAGKGDMTRKKTVLTREGPHGNKVESDDISNSDSFASVWDGGSSPPQELSSEEEEEKEERDRSMSWNFDPFPSRSKKSKGKNAKDKEGVEMVNMEKGERKKKPKKRKKKKRRKKRAQRRRDGFIEILARCFKREVLDMLCNKDWGIQKVREGSRIEPTLILN